MSAVRFAAALFLPFSFVILKAADATLPSVDEIVQKNIEARGGAAKIKAIQTRKMVGITRINDAIEAQVTVQAKRPNLYRMDVNLPQASMVEAFDGTTAWSMSPLTGGVPQKHDAATTRFTADEADMDGPLLDYKAKGTRVELVGVEDVGGSPAYHLKVTTRGGTVSNVWIDEKSWREVKMTQMQHQNGQEVEVTTLFSDFRPEGGEVMPMSIEQQVGQTKMKTEFSAAEANQPLDDSVFRMPAGAPAATQ